MSNRVLWSGRFKESPSDQTLAFTSSLAVDRRLAWYDIVGSIAHAKMLGRQGIIPRADADKIVLGLKEILEDVESGEFRFAEKLEDVHTNVEFRLTERIGDAGAKLHTARSRNDQVATDFRMYLRDATLEICGLTAALQKSLMNKAEENLGTVMPGFTHTQHAQPVTLAHHLLAHAARLQRDTERLLDSYARTNVCPLGSAALAGTTYPIDRRYAARSLGFSAPCENSMDGVSDRDFAVEFTLAAALLMAHLSSLCEEIVLWSSSEFGFVEVSDAFATGSSMMPQKKNPDVAELIRGRSGTAFGGLTALLVMIKSLPLSYNRDLQEDKGTTLAIADSVQSCLEMAAPMVATLKFDQQRMKEACAKGYLNATELADYLVTKGMPFRMAHETTGKIVRCAIAKGVPLEDLPLKVMKEFSDLISKDVYRVLKLQSCVDRRTSYGGTSPKAVKVQLENARRSCHGSEQQAAAEREKLQKAFSRLLSSN